MTFPVLTVSVRPDDVGIVDEACNAVAGCGPSGLLSVGLLVVVAAFLALFLAAALTRIHEARSIVDEERERAVAERDAFRTFTDRITDIDATPAASVETAGTVGSIAARPADRRLKRVREAYAETVMAVPHYEIEYDESLEENMAAELGEEVAAAVTGGGPLTPQVKQTLLQGSREASRRRDELVDDLDREAEMLADARDSLEAIDSTVEDTVDPPLHRHPFDRLIESWERLEDLEDRCQELVRDRQENIHTASGSMTFDAPTLQEYLYRDLDVTHPVVADATDVLSRIREARADVVEAITRRA